MATACIPWRWYELLLISWQKTRNIDVINWWYWVWEPEIPTPQLIQCNSPFDRRHNVFLWVSVASQKLLTVEKLDQNIKDYQRSRVCALHNHWWSTLTSPSLDALHMVICFPDYYFIWLICKFKQTCCWLALIHHWCQNIREEET